MSRSSRRPSASRSIFCKRLFLWSVPACLVLGAIAFVVVKMAIDAYLHSESFRLFIARKAGVTLHSECDLEPLQFSGMSVYTDGFKARGETGAPFSSLALDQLRAEISLKRFFDHVWEIEQVETQRVEIHFDGSRAPSNDADAFPQTASTVAPAKPGWLPNRVEISSATVRDANLMWKGGSLQGSALKLAPSEGGWNIASQSGRIQQAGLPSLDVQNLRLHVRDRSIFINDAVFRQGGDGIVKVTGEAVAGDHLDLKSTIENISVTPFLEGDWRVRLKGNLSGDVNVSTPLPVPASGLPVSGTLRLVGGELTALPVLDQIATFTATQQFRRLVLKHVEGDFQQDGKRLQVSKFVLESEGLIRVEGAFTVENSMIDGTFQVGVTPASLQWMPGSREKVFMDNHDGYVWAPMRLVGPLDKPKEDLTPRLIAATQGAVIEGAQNAVKEGIKTGRDAVKGALDLLLPAVK
jgi:hypothetical protein